MCTIKKNEFVKIFIQHFLPNIKKRKLKKYHCFPPKHGYLWNAFEYDLVPNLKGVEAAMAYDKADKHNAIEFQYDNNFMGDNFSVPLSNNNDTSKKIFESGLIEFYVFGEDFSWCFIVTHEPSSCGPYFIKNN